jgi:hypothetical protein
MRQVGNDQDLVTLSDIGQCSRHLNPDFSTDPLVDFIEHQGGDGIMLHQNDLESEHEPGEFTARCDLGQRPRFVTLIELHVELDCFRPVNTGFGKFHKLYGELAPAETQLR